MNLKSALIALAGNVGKCQENARSLKLELERGLLEASKSAVGAWTLIKTETGSTAIEIPDTYSELFVVVTKSNRHFIQEILPYEFISNIADETTEDIINGYYKNESTNGFCMLHVTNASIALYDLTVNGSNTTSAASLSVYGR